MHIEDDWYPKRKDLPWGKYYQLHWSMDNVTVMLFLSRCYFCALMNTVGTTAFLLCVWLMGEVDYDTLSVQELIRIRQSYLALHVQQYILSLKLALLHPRPLLQLRVLLYRVHHSI